jgi:tetratricopeptide (TPR) repeat protein
MVLLAVLVPTARAQQQEDVRPYRAAGKASFDAGKYPAAATNLKKYLAVYEKDYDAWSLLGATYFHTGMPQKSLKLLKKASRGSTYKSLNYYYQGLCYIALSDIVLAQRYLAAAAKHNDFHASLAIVELAVLEYRQRNTNEALYFANFYLQNFPNGPYTKSMMEIRDSVISGEQLTELPRTTPDVQKALYAHSKFSLFKYPNFWFIQPGYLYEYGTYKTPQADPIKGAFLRDEGYSNQFANLGVGVGIGPVEDKGAVSHFGYNYIQHWVTTNDRIDDYFEDPADFRYIPFRFDLMERHHQFYIDIKKSINDFSFGMNTKYEINRMGSSMLASAEDHDLRNVVNISQISTTIPWIRVSYGSNYSTTGYLFLRREIDEEQKEFSNSTFSSLFGSDPILLSGGAIQRMLIPRIKTELTGEVFRYETMYNDYWLDNTRTGGLINIQWRPMPHLRVALLGGYYQDIFDIEHIRSESCTFQSGRNYSSTPNAIKKCPREDTGMLVQLGAEWRLSQFQSVSGYYRYEEATNQRFQMHDRNSTQIFFSVTYTFPDIDTVLPFIEKLEDKGFDKKVR